VQTAPVAKESRGWQSTRLEGRELLKLQHASLQQLIAGGIGKTGCNLYAIAVKTSARQCWVSQRQAGSESSSGCQGVSAFQIW